MSLITCPACGKPATTEVFDRTRDGVTTRVTRTKCTTYERKQVFGTYGRGRQWKVLGCPLHDREEPIEVPILDKDQREALVQKIQASGMTKREVSQRAGLAKDALSKAISGIRQFISEDALAKVNEVLDNARSEQTEPENPGQDQQDDGPMTEQERPKTVSGPAVSEKRLTQLEARLDNLEHASTDWHRHIGDAENRMEDHYQALWTKLRAVDKSLEEAREVIRELQAGEDTPEQPGSSDFDKIVDALGELAAGTVTADKAEAGDVYDQFRQFEASARAAYQRDRNLFQAVVRRVWADNGAGA